LSLCPELTIYNVRAFVQINVSKTRELK